MCSTDLSQGTERVIPGLIPALGSDQGQPAHGCQGACSAAKKAACPLAQMMARLAERQANEQPGPDITIVPRRRPVKARRYHYARRRQTKRLTTRTMSYRSRSALHSRRRSAPGSAQARR
ncbi:MAG: hypothetical protein AAFV74_13965 [Pseudomonadota bacterium]